MPKYRRLSSEEFEALEKEFIDFLVLNGITAPDWQKLKDEEAEKAHQIMDSFSDVVLEGVLRKAEYVEMRSSKEVILLKTEEKGFNVVALRADESSEIDFNKPDLMMELINSGKAKLSVGRNFTEYRKGREMDLFEILSNGGFITDERMYNAVNQLKN